jgi:hypothetical protein
MILASLLEAGWVRSALDGQLYTALYPEQSSIWLGTQPCAERTAKSRGTLRPPKIVGGGGGTNRANHYRRTMIHLLRTIAI